MKQTPSYDVVNEDLLGLVPTDCRRAVDVGCMLGSLAKAIRQRSPHTQVVGLDIDPDYARIAAEHCSEAFAWNVETLDPLQWSTLFPSDCWIFGDCLEHLRDPWKVLRTVRASIDPNGCLLVCLPNAQHWTVQWRLASGQFRYESSGLMDQTHLRWFTRTTLLEMFQSTGWSVDRGLSRNLPAVPAQDGFLQGLRQLALAGGFDADAAVSDAIPFQYVFKCRPA